MHIAGELDRKRGPGPVAPALCKTVCYGDAELAATEVTVADQQDVASELVNMIGGNLKSLLPGPSFLSLPTIVSGREFGLQVARCRIAGRSGAGQRDGLMGIRLYVKVQTRTEVR